MNLCPLNGGQVESDEYCARVLKARMEEKSLPACEIIGDVKGYRPEGPAKRARVVSAGFPCQVGSSLFDKGMCQKFIMAT